MRAVQRFAPGLLAAALLAAAVCLRVLIDVPERALARSHAGGAQGAPRFRDVSIDAALLGGKRARIRGRSGRPETIGVGPLVVSGAYESFAVEKFETELPQQQVFIRAERASLDPSRIELSGAVRIDHDGRGVLFSDRVIVRVRDDVIEVPGIAVLGPTGEGGAGGFARPGFRARLSQLIAASRVR